MTKDDTKKKNSTKTKKASRESGSSAKTELDHEKIQMQKGVDLCLRADKLYFGIGVKQDKKQAIQLYKESSENDCSKANLALAALHEPIDT